MPQFYNCVYTIYTSLITQLHAYSMYTVLHPAFQLLLCILNTFEHRPYWLPTIPLMDVQWFAHLGLLWAFVLLHDHMFTWNLDLLHNSHHMAWWISLLESEPMLNVRRFKELWFPLDPNLEDRLRTERVSYLGLAICRWAHAV